ncbi:hypothetical protein K450DRAFT_247251 [Umbelopsis ramanniana AG]|uniref:Zn(2)-C6 fungal-type domain-containing protein n=1 Tax=Umbelopsis ramanniana AG TaxID=1314678 RepID=A0AAD5E8J4_UMBRA|nr:uncharacterized protein K450DRAFT_247251 [Umbelopsis ramanniana AG]KAI8578315.1 hypothetical protein K450DRAFT_247251 [Umbelopsis ramanniana AG]
MFEPISCIECRRRKVKCNRRNPCDQCTLRKAAMDCKYPTALRRRRAPDTEDSQELETLRSRLNDVESLLADIQQKNQPDDAPMEELSKYLDHAALASMLKPLRESLENYEQSISYVFEEYDDPTALLLPRIMDNEDTETDFIAFLIAYFFQLADHPYVSSAETYELVRQMHTLNQDGLLLLMILATSSRSLPSNHPVLTETGLTAGEISERFMESYNKQRSYFTKESLATVQAHILACYHHMAFERVESGWKSMVAGVGAAWSINLHVVNPSRPTVPQERRCQIWAALSVLEATVCGTQGRPNLITIAGLQSDVHSTKQMTDTSSLCRQINIQTTTGLLMDYHSVLAFDAAIDDEVAKLEHSLGGKPQIEGVILELLAVQAKLHQPHITSHPQSEKKMTFALTKFLYHLKNIVMVLGNDLNTRITLLQCRFVQVLIILYTYFHTGGSLLDRQTINNDLSSIIASGVWRENAKAVVDMIVYNPDKRVELNLDADSFPGMVYALTQSDFIPEDFFGAIVS